MSELLELPSESLTAYECLSPVIQFPPAQAAAMLDIDPRDPYPRLCEALQEAGFPATWNGIFEMVSKSDASPPPRPVLLALWHTAKGSRSKYAKLCAYHSYHGFDPRPLRPILERSPLTWLVSIGRGSNRKHPPIGLHPLDADIVRTVKAGHVRGLSIPKALASHGVDSLWQSRARAIGPAKLAAIVAQNLYPELADGKDLRLEWWEYWTIHGLRLKATYAERYDAAKGLSSDEGPLYVTKQAAKEDLSAKRWGAGAQVAGGRRMVMIGGQRKHKPLREPRVPSYYLPEIAYATGHRFGRKGDRDIIRNLTGIRCERWGGQPATELAEIYGVTLKHILNIQDYEVYGDVPDGELDAEAVQDIRAFRMSTYADYRTAYPVSNKEIWRIQTRLLYPYVPEAKPAGINGNDKPDRYYVSPAENEALDKLRERPHPAPFPPKGPRPKVPRD